MTIRLILSSISGNFLSGPETIKREFGNLKAIGDDYPKYVVTIEDITGLIKEYPGIHHINLREFLKTDF